MEVVLARAMGFCFGVNRAMSRIEEEAGQKPAPCISWASWFTTGRQ